MMQMNSQEISSKKLAAGLLGIFLGSLGIHKFFLGYHMEGRKRPASPMVMVDRGEIFSKGKMATK